LYNICDLNKFVLDAGTAVVDATVGKDVVVGTTVVVVADVIDSVVVAAAVVDSVIKYEE